MPVASNPIPTPIPAPTKKKEHGPLRVWALLAEEPSPPKGVPALRWKLLSTHPVETPEASLEQVGWYVRRWGIEELFKTLKSGCRVEARHDDAVAGPATAHRHGPDLGVLP